MSRILVVDDEENIRLVLETLLSRYGYEVDTAQNGEEALLKIEAKPPDFVIADVRMPGISGIELTKKIKDMGLDIVVMVMSAYGNVELAIEAMKHGAYDFVSKPFKQDEVLMALKKAEERESLRKEVAALRAVLDTEHHDSMNILGRSAPIREVMRMVSRAKDFTTTVLIQGESGTGKELVAKALHEKGARKNKPFVALNCGAIPENLIESELFGHKKGSFTDASSDKTGLFEVAHEGTLFLDEVGELPMATQVKLLRVLQESIIRRIGDTKDRKIDVRIVAATMKNLEQEVKDGHFREDLFYRLNVLNIVVPPLRQRKDDLPLLIEHFIRKNNLKMGTTIRGLNPEAKKLFLDHGWPGNVRELENTIERAMVLAEGEWITEQEVPDRIKKSDQVFFEDLGTHDLSIKKAERYIEEMLIRRALERTGGNRTAAAKLLELSHRALLYKVKEYGIG